MSDEHPDTAKHPNPTTWWRHRRKGYYTGMWWGIIQTPLWVACELYEKGLIDGATPVVAWSYGLSITLIAAYYSNTAIEEWVKGGVKR